MFAVSELCTDQTFYLEVRTGGMNFGVILTEKIEQSSSIENFI